MPKYAHTCADLTDEDEAVERTQAQPVPGSPANTRGQDRDGAAHPDSLRAPRTAQPREAPTLLTACGTSPTSTPAKRSGPTPTTEHCMLC